MKRQLATVTFLLLTSTACSSPEATESPEPGPIIFVERTRLGLASSDVQRLRAMQIERAEPTAEACLFFENPPGGTPDGVQQPRSATPIILGEPAEPSGLDAIRVGEERYEAGEPLHWWVEFADEPIRDEDQQAHAEATMRLQAACDGARLSERFELVRDPVTAVIAGREGDF